MADLAGWVPAVIFPGASFLQLLKVIRSESVAGISIVTWLLFVLANLGMYVFTEKYFVIQSIITNLLTAAIQGSVVVVVWVRKT